ncbi:extracelular serine carboxypeptidase [Aulographum hederae CBS 113979]|uniref:Extracelular serine carboxypeptidase n=1 Tax=Aulographum hederae CBS 113979 TaxID=1176131 RepID=A0A6G1GLG0_9PEZI|nr:extracelular serine carboxypeptidase [Aulographum hederae CBS 113979]
MFSKLLINALLLGQAVHARFAVRPPIELQRLTKGSSAFDKRDYAAEHPAYSLQVPVDYFHNDSKYEPHSDAKFPLRYWFDASHYEEGGPVIVLCGGETDGSDRLPFMEKGILYQLSKATKGVGVILEHRYYGESFPVANLTTESLRFLTTAQALADSDYFARHVTFPGLEDKNLTAPATPWVAYGGSYAGAFVAFLRVQYPHTFFGAISSSGVTKAIYDYWQYYEPIRIYGPQDCIKTTQQFTSFIDSILIEKKDASAIVKLKAAFGLSNLTHDDDFANVLSYGIGGWQGRNWDPEVNDPSFNEYCKTITSDTPISNSTEPERAALESLLEFSGVESSSSFVTRLLNWINYINVGVVQSCTLSRMTQNQCFSQYEKGLYSGNTLLAYTWKSWSWQYCTEWGFLQTGSGVPADQQPLISRLINLPYTTIICKEGFGRATPPDTDTVNKYGGYDISYPRLAIVDGQADPWREATPHAFAAPNRTSTTKEPFILIEGAVHHWDENGLFANETTPELPPAPVADAQQQIHDFVLKWLEEWKRERHVKSNGGWGGWTGGWGAGRGKFYSHNGGPPYPMP